MFNYNGKTFDKEVVLDGTDPRIQELLFKHGFHWGTSQHNDKPIVRERDNIKIGGGKTRLFGSGNAINMTLEELKVHLQDGSRAFADVTLDSLVGRKITRGGKHVYRIEANGDTSDPRLAVISNTDKGIPANYFSATEMERFIREGKWAFVDEPKVTHKFTRDYCENSKEMQEYLFKLGYIWSHKDKVQEIKHLPNPYIYMNREGSLTHSTTNTSKYTFQSLAEIKAKYPLEPTTNPETTNETITQETSMSNILSKYSTVNFAAVVLFRGQCITDFNKASYMSMIRQLNEEIDSYSDIKNSEAIDTIVADLTKDLKQLTALFDTFMKGSK